MKFSHTSTLNRLLDTLHTASTEIATITQHRRQLRRKHITVFVNVASTLFSAIAVIFPQAGVIANILNNLQRKEKQYSHTLNKPQSTCPNDLIVRLQTITTQIDNSTGEQRLRLEAQRDLLLKMLSDHKQTTL